MALLPDTNVLVRLASQTDPAHRVARRAVAELERRGEVLNITAQNLVEFRAVATRPLGANELGPTPVAAAALVAGFEAVFPLRDETPAGDPAGRAIVDAVGVAGRQVSDARRVAVCHVHGVAHMLTFNVAHFRRLAAAPPGVVVIDPATV